MKKRPFLALLVMACLIHISTIHATEHHSGHRMPSGGGGDSASACMKPHVSKFLPAHLATVAPGAEFSFVAFNIHKPENISVTVKQIPVAVTSEFKDPFYVVKGKLPESLKNTAARINVKVTGKTSHCEIENGWLVKISE